MRQMYSKFAADQSGTVAVIFSLTVLPVLAAIGAAVDYGRVTSDQQRLQAALDAAVLAGVEAPAAIQTTAANNALQASLANSGLRSVSATWTSNSDGSLSGSADAIARSVFMQNFGVSSVHVTATSKALPATVAPIIPSSAQILATSARGIYWKKVQFFIHNAGAASDTAVATYVYQPTNLSGDSNAVGKITVTLADGTSWTTDSNGNLLSGSSKAVSLGSSYDNAYLVITVSPSGCAPGYEVDPTQSLSAMKCIAAGATVRSSNSSLQNSSWYNIMDSFSTPTCKSYSWGYCTSYAYTINPIGPAWTFATNSSTQTNQLFVSNTSIPQPPTSAVQLPLGSVPSIQTLIPCGQTTYWAMEDTPWKPAGLSDGAWQSQDFFFTIQGVTCTSSTAIVSALPRLTQ